MIDQRVFEKSHTTQAIFSISVQHALVTQSNTHRNINYTHTHIYIYMYIYIYIYQFSYLGGIHIYMHIGGSAVKNFPTMQET